MGSVGWGWRGEGRARRARVLLSLARKRAARAARLPFGMMSNGLPADRPDDRQPIGSEIGSRAGLALDELAQLDDLAGSQLVAS